VRRWWGGRETYDEIREHYLSAIGGERPTDLYIALLDDEPIGFVQTYLVSDYPDYRTLVGAGEGVAGVDLFIGDAALTGQGIDSEILHRLSLRSCSPHRRPRAAWLTRMSGTSHRSAPSRRRASVSSRSSSIRRTDRRAPLSGVTVLKQSGPGTCRGLIAKRLCRL
jgi:hypothetical protein